MAHKGPTLVNRFLYWVARMLLDSGEWTVRGTLPNLDKYVIVIAPHTSYWDLPYLLAAEANLSHGLYDFKLSWMGKAEAFWGPLGTLLKKLGGVPIDRRSSQNRVEQIVKAYGETDSMVLVILPEGTRKKATRWKTGFYYIALGAHVPILLAYLDYKTRTAGIGPLLTPSGDIEADMQTIRQFYRGFSGKHPEKVGAITIYPSEVEEQEMMRSPEPS